MRILFVPAVYLPSVGGVQINTHYLAQELTHRGHQVTVLTRRYPFDTAPYEVMDGIPVYRVPFYVPRQDPLSLLAFLARAPQAWQGTRRLLHELHPDLVNVHFVGANAFFVALLRSRLPCPLVVTLRGTNEAPNLEGEPWLETLILNRTARAILRRAQFVTAVSADLLQKAEAAVPGILQRSAVTPVGVDLSLFDRATPHPGRYVLGMGTLTAIKGFDVLLKAFRRVVTRYPDLSLILAGDGEERPRLAALAGELGLSSRVQFWGPASRSEAASLLRGCQFFAVPSRREGLGVVSLEAFASRKPVVASRTGGIPEIVRHGQNGLLVKPDDPDALAAGMLWLLDHPVEARLMGQCGRAMAEDMYTWKKEADRFEEVYRRLLVQTQEAV